MTSHVVMLRSDSNVTRTFSMKEGLRPFFHLARFFISYVLEKFSSKLKITPSFAKNSRLTPKVQNLFMANQTFFVHFTMTACRAVVQVSSSRVQLGNYIKYYSTCNFHHLHLEQFCGSVTSSFRGLLLCLLIYSSHY